MHPSDAQSRSSELAGILRPIQENGTTRSVRGEVHGMAIDPSFLQTSYGAAAAAKADR